MLERACLPHFSKTLDPSYGHFSEADRWQDEGLPPGWCRRMTHLLIHPLHEAQVVENGHHTSKENDGKACDENGEQVVRCYIAYSV